VLERNAELFPGSPMPFNALAEFYVSQGRPAEAVRLFQKALAIDPKDEYASMRLKRLESLEPPAPK
jgi:Flp pilus assembly protein TadD